ncbi:hypothetical protein AMJ85_11680 [candidate division BRC1 bacterium SM23_51]|nr:MAG: hypothetical protein AMJ85_11680 [candidate division BRC1 bacterium SM23_51]
MKAKHWSQIVLLGALVASATTVARAAEVQFEKVVIDRGNAEGCSVVDVNGDGLLDIVALPNWYRAPHWDERPIHEVRRSGEFLMNYGQIAMDVNGDGAVDIVSAGWYDKDIFWYENPKTFKNKADEYKTWTRYTLPTPPSDGTGCETVMAADVDGDGQTDVVPNRRPLGWYRLEKDTEGKPAFKRYAIDLSGRRGEEWLHGLGLGDINGDGREDIMTGEGWWEKPPNPRTDKWTEHRDFVLHDASVPILILDLDGDGDSDFIYGNVHNYGFFWMEQVREGGERKWARHVIDKSWSQVHTMVWVDLDGDGENEVVTGKRWRGHSGDDPGGHDPLGIYYYKFDLATKNWEKRTISYDEHIGTGMQLCVVDIDKDGDLDIVAPGKSGLYLLRNVTKK